MDIQKNKLNVLFVIPARGGSKGLPKKNIKPIAGKPLITWSIEAALKAAQQIGSCDVVVSTDSEEIAAIALQAGALVPFMRPESLANDTAASIDVMLHALHDMEQKGQHYQYIAMIEPTSPQRDEHDLVGAYQLLQNTENAESIVGVCKTECAHPLFLTKLQQQFLVPYENKTYKVYRRQEIDSVYFFEGSMYISNTESIKKRKSFYHEKTLGYEMPKWKSFEIDDLTDFIIIEQLLNARKEGLLK
ncbi:MAG: acylneuraminate cytidylyltransferase family protein [Bacteroidetes bacterium]|nr:acylneuraminate cytidylyltransferase family protein [Bacteroidota bacterium]